MHRLFSCAIALAMCLSAAINIHAADEEGLKVGDAAPDFKLVGSDGKMYQLSDFKDKQVVVVAWYPRAFTGGCTKECKSFATDGAKLKAYNVAYFTASTDDAEKNKKFAESVGADYPILSDPTGATAKAYGIYNAERNAAQRVTFIIDAKGNIAHIDRAVKTESHAADVAAKLGELGVEKKK
jgi:peroxiredoxin Q/BCP